MKILLKKSIIILITFTICVLLTICLFFDDNTKSYKTVSKYVIENIEILNDFPYDELPSNPFSDEYKRKIKELLGDDTIVEKCSRKDTYNKVYYYYCGGSGFSGGSTYTGFYYSGNNKPCSMNIDVNLAETSEGVFEWKNDDGSHYIMTQRIIDNWFYYYEDWY